MTAKSVLILNVYFYEYLQYDSLMLTLIILDDLDYQQAQNSDVVQNISEPNFQRKSAPKIRQHHQRSKRLKLSVLIVQQCHIKPEITYVELHPHPYLHPRLHFQDMCPPLI